MIQLFYIGLLELCMFSHFLFKYFIFFFSVLIYLFSFLALSVLILLWFIIFVYFIVLYLLLIYWLPNIWAYFIFWLSDGLGFNISICRILYFNMVVWIFSFDLLPRSTIAYLVVMSAFTIGPFILTTGCYLFCDSFTYSNCLIY